MIKVRSLQDYRVGDTGVTHSRTVGATEISNFAGITCDYNFLHTSEQEAAETFYGGRIAHGLLGCSLAIGQLSMDAPATVGRTVDNSYLCGFDIRYRNFIAMDDSVRTAWTIAEVLDDDGSGFGMVKVAFDMVNQRDKVVYSGNFNLRVPMESVGLGDINPIQAVTNPPWQPEEIDFDPGHTYSIEDFREGIGGVTSGRTLTETDVINFVSLTGDHHAAYVDQTYGEKSAFGGRIVPPMLVFDLALGYWSRDSWIARAKTDSSAMDIGHLGDDGRFYQPVYVGDTIRCVYRINNTRPSSNHPDRTVVDYGFQIVNQHNIVVQEGHVFVVKGNTS
jgi:acyl dehydratase